MPTGTTKITHRDVIAYLVGLDPEMRELVLDLAKQEIAAHDAKRATLSARLAKARKNIGKGKRAPQAAATQASTDQDANARGLVQADPEVQREVAEQIPAHSQSQRARHRSQHPNEQVMTAAVE